MNDDARFTIGPNAVFAAEGNAGTTPMAFTVTRTGFLNTIAAVSWNVTPGTLAGTLPISADDFAGGVLPSGAELAAVLRQPRSSPSKWVRTPHKQLLSLFLRWR
jgi:hypothetical protein